MGPERPLRVETVRQVVQGQEKVWINLGPSAGLNLGPSAGLNLGHMGHMGKQYIRVYAASAYKYTYKRNVYTYITYTRLLEGPLIR